MSRAPLMLLLAGVLCLAVLVFGRGEAIHEEIPLRKQDVEMLFPAPPADGPSGSGEHWRPL